jgi:hypothetical protein
MVVECQFGADLTMLAWHYLDLAGWHGACASTPGGTDPKQSGRAKRAGCGMIGSWGLIPVAGLWHPMSWVGSRLYAQLVGASWS